MLEVFIGIGVVTSLIYYEITEISPGGLISPMYLVLFIDQPKRILGTVLIAVIICFMLKFIGKYLPIYGKRRFAIAVVLGIVLKLLISGVAVGSYTAIGSIIPGLIAFECDKQGVTSTCLSLFIVTVFLKILMIAMQGRYFLW